MGSPGPPGDLCCELGWELYVSTDQAAHVFEAIDAAGADSG